MVVNHKFLDIIHQASLKGHTLEGVYRRIQDRELFLIAYGNLYANDGALTPGIDPHDIIDGMSLKRIDAITEALNNNAYKWTPVRRIHIPKKKSSGKRPLGIPGWKDKLLQEVIRLVLEAYYEPRFSDDSHGYRPGRGCHTALSTIYHCWRGTKWFIEGDIKGCFDNLRHGVILDILATDIRDNRFIALIRGMLRAGYLENWVYHKTYSGAPQGAVASPIIANIVLNELDKFVQNELYPEYNWGSRHDNLEYRSKTTQIRQAKRKRDWERVRELTQERKGIPTYVTHDPHYRRLRYNRYADDVLFGFTGPRKEAEEIKEKVGWFLGTLGIEMSQEKTLITHAATGKARYLGYDITVMTSKQRPRVNYHIQLLVPPEVKQDWLKKYTKKGKPCSRSTLLEMTDFEIVRTYGAEFRGIVNYYRLAENVSSAFYHVKDIGTRSLAVTLANKHKTSAYKIYKKYIRKSDYGVKALIVELPNPQNPNKPYRAQMGERPIKRDRRAVIQDREWQPCYLHTELTERLLADKCELCGSTEGIQSHHVRKLADLRKRYAGHKDPPPWVEFMIKRRRKTVVVCSKCHLKIHAGTYDGPRVN